MTQFPHPASNIQSAFGRSTRSQRAEPATEYYYKTEKQIFSAILLLTTTAFSLWFAYTMETGPEKLRMGLATFGAFTLCGAFVYARRATDRGAIITISQMGLHDRRLTKAPIPWNQVASVALLEQKGRNYLVVSIDDLGSASPQFLLTGKISQAFYGLALRTPGMIIEINDFEDGTVRLLADIKGRLAGG